MGLTQNLGLLSTAIKATSTLNVGIGTSSPTYGLDIASSDAVKAFLRITKTSGAQAFLQAFDDAAYCGTLTSHPLIISTNSTERMRITSAGNVGIGTSSPNVSSQGANNTLMTIQGQSGSYGMLEIGATTNTAESLIGVLGFTSTTVTGGLLGFISMASEGTTGTNVGGRIQFNTKSNGGGISERMRITSGGFLKASNSGTYANAAYPTYEITSNSNGYNAFELRHSGNTDPYIAYLRFSNAAPNNTSNYFIYGDDTSTNRFIVYSNGNIVNRNGSYGTLSDATLKENIIDASPKLADIIQLKVRNFNLIGDENKQIGFIAQEFEEVFPSMVETDGRSEKKMIKTSVLVPILVKAIQELKAEIEQLKQK